MDDIKDLSIEESSKTIIKEKKNRTIQYYLLVFAIPVICMIIHMVLKECYPFGENTVLRGDAGLQYMAFFREWLEQIEDGGSFLFNWNGGMGYEFYTTYWYYLASPFNWLIFLFGQKYLELGMILILLIQIGGCGVTSCYYFMHSKINKLEKGTLNNLVCVLFSLAFSMCDYFLAYQYNMMWLISLMLMPLVLLGIERLVDGKDGRLYGVTLFLVLVTNFYFAWFICIFAVIWFIDQKKENIKSGLKSFFHFAVVSVLAAMCAAFVLIPCYLYVLGLEGQAASDYDVIDTFGNIGDFVQSFFWGSNVDFGGNAVYTYNNYCGIFIVFLVLVYMFSKKIGLRQRVKRIAEILVVSFALNCKVMQYIFHGFTYPSGFNSRFMFILVFILIITALEALSSLETIRIRYMGIAAVLFAGLTVVALVFNDDVQDIWCYMVTVMVFAYFLICAVLLKRKSIKKSSMIINVLVIGFIEIIVNSFLVNTEAYDLSREKELEVEEWYNNYTDIEADDDERKTAFMLDRICIQCSDTDIFSSATSTDMVELYADLGMGYQYNKKSYVYRGTTPLITALFNVDYILTDSGAYYGGYTIKDVYSLDDEEYGIYTSLYNAEIGFMLPEEVLNWNTDDENPFEVQNNFTNDVLNQGNIFTRLYFEDVQIGASGCVVTDSSDNSYDYINIGLSDASYACIELSFTVPYDMHLYAYTSDTNLTLCQVYIDGEMYLGGEYWYPGTMIDFGELKEGQEVVLGVASRTSILDEGTAYVDFYTYNDEVMQDCLSIMNESPLVLDAFEDTYVSGRVTAEEDGVLYTSIPYYKGWTLYVDGEETEITKIADALVGVELTAGEHTIELKYFPYGLKIGIIISIVGLAGMVIYFSYFKKRSDIAKAEH